MTLFEKIYSGEISADIIDKTDTHMAFLDINPKALGHTLVIPAKPYTWFIDMPADEFAELMEYAQGIAMRLRPAASADYIHLAIVGTDVPHVHVHLIPQKLGNESHGYTYADGEQESFIQAYKQE